MRTEATTKVAYPKPNLPKPKKPTSPKKVAKMEEAPEVAKPKKATNKSRMVAAIEALPKEFSAVDVAEKSGLTVKQISGYLMDLVRQGDVTKKGKGLFGQK